MISDIEVDSPEVDLTLGDQEEYNNPIIEEISLSEDDISQLEDSGFYKNLAYEMQETDLSSLSSSILKGIQEDIDSRYLWEEQYSRGFELLGLVKDKKEKKSSTMSYVFDSTMMNAVVANYARTMPNLFRDDISKYSIKGPKDDAICHSGYKIQELINDYLKNGDKGYKQDSKKMLMYLILLGCVFRKVYQDPVSNLPTARFIKPQNFIVNNNSIGVEECERITHAYHLNKKDILIRESSGYFLKSDIPVSGNEENIESSIEVCIRRLDGGVTDDNENSSNFRYFESHVYLNEKCLMKFEKETDEIPRPYVVTICAQTKKIVSIIRNWKPDDDKFDRINCFIRYEYIPGFGFYGYGIVHLLGNNSRALTTQMRQFIDSISYSILQGGFKLDFKTEHNNVQIEPGQFYTVKTLEGSQRIQDMIMGLPYKQPGTTMLEAIRDLRSGCQDLVGSATSKMSEISPHASEGTTLAILEKHNEVSSVVVQSLVDSLYQELNMILGIFKDNFKDTPYRIYDSNSSIEITKEDFNERIFLVPSCEPSLSTVTQRIAKNDALLRIASSAPPGIFNMRAIFKNMVNSMDMGEVEDVMIPEEQPFPLDPVTENMFSITGKPIQAFLEQDHQSHIHAHNLFMQANPQTQAVLSAHISDHLAKLYLIQMQQMTGIMIPQDGRPMDMNAQNMIAMKVSEASKQLMQQNQQSQQNQQQPLDPTIAMLEEVKQREKAAAMKYETDKERIELDAYKAQLQFETEKKKMEIEEKIAEERNAANIEAASLKQRKWE